MALDLRDIDFHLNGTGQALIRRGKTDAIGQRRADLQTGGAVKWDAGEICRRD